MSVAFRRESDDEHKEPTFELPIPPGANLVRPSGLAQIEAKVADLAAAIAADTDEARQASLKRDLRYWQTRRATAQVVAPPAGDGVGVGSRVTYRLGGETRTVTLVGADEADPAAGLIAFHAPLARAIARAADEVEIAFGGAILAIVEIDNGQG